MVAWAEDFLARDLQEPFFLGLGIFRPHIPWYVPKKYFELYPIEEIVLPEVIGDDMADIPVEGLEIAAYRTLDRRMIEESGLSKRAIQAYLASVSFADAQLGKLLDAIESSDYAENSIIVLWSDHGWHHGQKKHWHKYTLWEEATRVPLVIALPGRPNAGTESKQPVNLVDLYPTLLDLVGMQAPHELDGISLVPQLKDPATKRTRPSITDLDRHQHAVRSERWRYIRYSDGTEELYDHDNDPNEWTNLARQPGYEEVLEAHRKYLPAKVAPYAPSLRDYDFDEKTYTFKRKEN